MSSKLTVSNNLFTGLSSDWMDTSLLYHSPDFANYFFVAAEIGILVDLTGLYRVPHFLKCS